MSEETSYVKNLGQVAAVVLGPTPPEKTFLLWYDTSTSVLKYYDSSQGDWTPLGGSSVTARNLETDSEGLIFKQKVGTVLYFRRVKGKKGISVTTEGDDIIVQAVDFLEVDTREIRFDSLIGQVGRLRINSNVEWEVLGTGDISWLSFDSITGLGSQYINMTVTAQNPLTTSRSATIIIRDTSQVLDDISVLLVQEGSQVFVATYIINSGDFECEQE